MAGAPGAEWWRPAPVDDDGTVSSATSVASFAPESTVSFLALIAFTVIQVLAPQNFVPVLKSLRIALIAGIVAIGSHVARRSGRGEPITVCTREMTVTGCLLAWAILTIPFSYWPGGSLSFLFDLYLKTLAVFWLVGNVVTTLSKLQTIAWALALMSIPLALTAVKNFLSGTYTPIVGGVAPPVARIMGYDAPLALNPNDLALMLNLIIPVAAGLLLAIRKPIAWLVLAPIIALDALAVVVTFSRAGFVTLAVVFAIYLWKLHGRPEAPWAWGALVIALACVPLLPATYGDRLTTIVDIDSDPTGSAQTRWDDTRAAVRFVQRNPLVGSGVGQNILALNEERGAAWKEVHNVYLEYAVELGLPGFVLFVLLLSYSIRSTVFAQRESAGKPALRGLFYLAEGVQISLLAFAVSGFFHPGGYQFGFYYFAGLAVATRVIAGATV